MNAAELWWAAALEHPVVFRWGWVLVHFLWQGALIAAAVGLALHLLRRAPAEIRYLVACGGLFAMILCLPLTFFLIDHRPAASAAGYASAPVSWQGGRTSRGLAEADSPGSPPVSVDSPAATPAQISPAPPSRIVRLALPGVVGLWLAGMGGCFLWHLLGLARVGRMTRVLQAVPPDVATRFRALRRRLGVGPGVRLATSPSVSVPCLAGVIRPVILLPLAAVAGLPRPQLEAMLMHELAHARRQDYLFNLLQSAVEAILFYHPAVWWLGRRIRREREHCCDDRAAALCRDPDAYARALLAVEKLRQGPSLPGPAMGMTGDRRPGALGRRIERLLQSKPSGTPPRTAGVLAGIFLAGVLALAVLPVGMVAQDPAPVDESRPGEEDESRSGDESESRGEDLGRADGTEDGPEGESAAALGARYLLLSLEIAELEQRYAPEHPKLAEKLQVLKSLRAAWRSAQQASASQPRTAEEPVADRADPDIPPRLTDVLREHRRRMDGDGAVDEVSATDRDRADSLERQLAARRELVALLEQRAAHAEKKYAEGTLGLAERMRVRADLLAARLGLAEVRGERARVMDIHREMVDLQETAVQAATQRYRAGASSEADVLAARVRWLEARIALEEARVAEDGESNP